MSNLRDVYTKALTATPPQTIDELVSRYRSIRRAILDEAKQVDGVYNVLFPYGQAEEGKRTLQEFVKTEKDDHLSALDGVFFTLTRGIKILVPPTEPEPIKFKTAVFRKYFKCRTEVSMGLRGRSGTNLNVEKLSRKFREEYYTDLKKIEGLAQCIFAQIFLLGLAAFCLLYSTVQPIALLYSGWFLFLSAALLIGWFIRQVVDVKKLIQQDIDNYQKWQKNKQQYDAEMERYKADCAEQIIRLKNQMQEGQTKPSTLKPTARIEL